MRLQKQLSRKIGQKEYVKWVITVPPKQIDRLGWNERELLESKIIENGIYISRVIEDHPSIQGLPDWKISLLTKENKKKWESLTNSL